MEGCMRHFPTHAIKNYTENDKMAEECSRLRHVFVQGDHITNPSRGAQNYKEARVKSRRWHLKGGSHSTVLTVRQSHKCMEFKGALRFVHFPSRCSPVPPSFFLPFSLPSFLSPAPTPIFFNQSYDVSPLPTSTDLLKGRLGYFEPPYQTVK